MTPAADPCALREPAPAAAPAREVDFTRPRVCLLGLPFDPIGLRRGGRAGPRRRLRRPSLLDRDAEPELRDRRAQRRRRSAESVLRSDLSLVDGMPLVWMARLLGMPVPERVVGLGPVRGAAGASRAAARHLPVRRAAGRGGARRRAHQRARRRRALRRLRRGRLRLHRGDERRGADRAHQPQRRALRQSPRSAPQKGQAWFAHNAARLAPPVLCHLGAVVNFAAGTVQPRAAPGHSAAASNGSGASRGSRRCGSATPATACGASRLVATRVVPAALAARSQRASAGATAPPVEIVRSDRAARSCARRRRAATRPPRPCASRSPIASPTRAASASISSSVAAVGNEFAAALLVADGWFGARGGFAVTGAGAAARADLRRLLCDELLRKGLRHDVFVARRRRAARPAPPAVSAEAPDWSREAKRVWRVGSVARPAGEHARLAEGRRAATAPTRSCSAGSRVLRHRFWSVVTGADIPLDCAIEGGLLMPHPNGIVIHPKAASARTACCSSRSPSAPAVRCPARRRSSATSTSAPAPRCSAA